MSDGAITKAKLIPKWCVVKQKLISCLKQPCKQRRSVSSLEEIVDCYVSQYRERASQTLQYYAQQPSLSDAVEKATDKRHIHQKRIPIKSLRQANSRLQLIVQEMSRCCSFTDLYQLVDREINSIARIGDLTVYDIAHRIGAKLGLAPKFVYLHAGTSEGAAYLDLRSPNGTLLCSALPNAFHRLSPAEIEDCLCICKDSIKKIMHQ